MAKKKPKTNNIDKIAEFARIANNNGMTYAELQYKETLGLVKVKRGKLLVKGIDY